jgi:hypothetical protein
MEPQKKALSNNQTLELIISNKHSSTVKIIYEPRLKETTYTKFKDEESKTIYQASTSIPTGSSTLISLRTPFISVETPEFMPITRLPIVKKSMVVIYEAKSNEIPITQDGITLATLKALNSASQSSKSRHPKNSLKNGAETSKKNDSCLQQ